eukprot:c24153_g1_i1 orf=142-1446(+)
MSYPSSIQMQTLGLFERSESFGMANYGALKCTFSTQAKLGHVREPYVWPDGRGRFGRYGGRYVPETVIPALQHLEATLTSLSTQPSFWNELRRLQRDYAGRETPLYFAARLSDHHKSSARGGGPLIYLKREDLNHTSSHSMNNALGQSLLAAHLGKRRIVAETGSGQEGISAAAAAARLGLECVIYMGAIDIERHPRNAARIKRLGAQLIPVHSGCSSLKDAMSEAMRDFITNIHTTYHMFGSVVGPHPFPLLVRNFQAIIGQETRQQALEKWGSKPHVLLSCVGRGSGALGLFHEFIEDEDVRLIGVEAGGVGMKNGLHASTLTSGDLGVFHGAMTYLLQDSYGQTQKTHSISSDLNYPCVGPELSHLKDIGRVEVYTVTDEEASKACKRLAKLEGIIPSLATSHALAYLEKLCPTLRHNDTIVVNCSGVQDE